MANSNRRFIGLITDFGNRGLHYIASMKAVIFKINPTVGIIDINHNISPFNIYEASYLLSSTYKYFPEESVFIIVVDPGVGSSREILAVKIDSNYYFIGPNNGIFTGLLKERITKCIKIQNDRYFIKPTSQTFHGRDIMAPVAAYITESVNLNNFGPKFDEKKIVQYPFNYEISITDRTVRGYILYIDHFGNCITNIPIDKGKVGNSSLTLADGDLISLIYEMKKYSGKFFSHYEAVPMESLFFLKGSFGMLEISINQGNAAKKTGLKTGDKFLIKL
jgi:S-adenosylmethionine hydrolase